MVLVWRRLLHSVVAMPVDGLPSAILAPEDQGGSDHDLGRLRAALELPPPALDEDPVPYRRSPSGRQYRSLRRPDRARTVPPPSPSVRRLPPSRFRCRPRTHIG